MLLLWKVNSSLFPNNYFLTPMDKITESGQTLVFDKRVHSAIRFGIFLVSLFPLLAPYELLFKIRWESFFNPSFFISLVFSIVMVAASAFVMFIALFAQNQHVCFNGERSTLTFGWSDAVRTYRETDYRFEEISEPELETQSWSDGPNSYDLLVTTRSGLKISFGDFKSKEKAQEYQEILAEIISISRHPESSQEDA
jgi:hypothetical protein